MIAGHLRIQPGQQALTPEQEAEAERFAEERIAAQLSTEPVDEAEAEQLLIKAYARGSHLPPQHIHWVDGPLQLDRALASRNAATIGYESVWDDVWERVEDSLWDSYRGTVQVSRSYREKDEGNNLWPIDWKLRVSTGVMSRARTLVGARVEARVWENVGRGLENGMWASDNMDLTESVQASARAYTVAHRLALHRFFDEYQEPNSLHALARFNEQVSGCWLGKKEAIIVRRPRMRSLDAESRLHSGTGRCVEYGDGWGCYAWHGVWVPEQVILRPETLTREDFLNEQNLEVRRVIQERMGERFVSELGGVVLDSSPRGTLYEVRLLANDPERTARYVQVQDASTQRQYFLRVPPTIQTAAEAVAWSFGRSVEEYHPTAET